MTYSTYGEGTCFWTTPTDPATCRVHFIYADDCWTELESCDAHLEQYVASEAETCLHGESPIGCVIYYFLCPWAERRVFA